MYVRCTNDATVRLFDESILGEDYPDGVEFGDSGVVQVTNEVGDALVDTYDEIERHQQHDSDTTSDTQSN